ncbi:uncharacterized protein MELLADRAFT_104283 [Melampsora larici-populina 98AG31]|uniref:Uncharacterized protein n=1 Tax=Melampsora larici-populina (strain 98AG31 / pathotype 3-4-7) TaxID=747676 RepID=F4RE74_MELLP|nr:uncharacterized protein MELLADRAFT_104283 [Melampsora larici-populina 98AG31]EGG09043.1 hypothetical protein MELLADRAFT_104283 [Melampsora larici-populina 98AG31]
MSHCCMISPVWSDRGPDPHARCWESGHEDFGYRLWSTLFTRISTLTPMATSIMSCCRLFTRSVLPSQRLPNQLRWNSFSRATEAGVSADRFGRLGPNGGVLLSEAQVQGLFDYPEFKHPSREVSAYKKWRLAMNDTVSYPEPSLSSSHIRTIRASNNLHMKLNLFAYCVRQVCLTSPLLRASKAEHAA